jgi:molecular chaperone DnaK
LESVIVELKAAKESQDVGLIQSKLDALNAAWAEATQNMGAGAQQQGNPQGPQGNVEDVDFEEVK